MARGSEQWVDGLDKGFAASTLRRPGEELANAVMRMDTPSANAACGRVIAVSIQGGGAKVGMGVGVHAREARHPQKAHAGSPANVMCKLQVGKSEIRFHRDSAVDFAVARSGTGTQACRIGL